MSKFEIETRGRLSPSQKADLEKFLAKNGRLIKKYKRTQWIFGLSYDKKIDLRIKQTNSKYEFSLKVGQLDRTKRKEISIPIPKDKVRQSFEFLKFLGFREGLKAVRNAEIYSYKGIEWSIVEVPEHSSYFEAEKVVDTKKEGGAAEKKIKQIAKKLKLKIFSPKETIDYIKILDTEVNKKFKL